MKVTDKKILLKLQPLFIVLGLVAIGLLMRDVIFGRIFIGLYGIAALVFAIPAGQTYKMAAIALVSIPVLSFVRGSIFSDTFAEYAFLLFVIGVICSFREVIKYIKSDDKHIAR